MKIAIIVDVGRTSSQTRGVTKRMWGTSGLKNTFFFLQYVLPELLQVVPATAYKKVWLIHDGESVHVSIVTRNHVHATYSRIWIGQGEPIDLPLHSADLNPSEFFFWGHLKS
ncbi:hypothetical protein TNCV_3003231 [Trichonephila clavipes]|nr:hypothetical protein TNCV_3003231 [Trichonephila clavipes]